MGYRLHVATKYDVNYSIGDAFNHKCEEFHDLLTACGASFTGDSYDDEFEVGRDEWNATIEKLKNLASLDDIERDRIQTALKWMDDSVEEIVSAMEAFEHTADPNNNFLHLAFF